MWSRTELDIVYSLAITSFHSSEKIQCSRKEKRGMIFFAKIKLQYLPVCVYLLFSSGHMKKSKVHKNNFAKYNFLAKCNYSRLISRMLKTRFYIPCVSLTWPISLSLDNLIKHNNLKISFVGDSFIVIALRSHWWYLHFMPSCKNNDLTRIQKNNLIDTSFIWQYWLKQDSWPI